MDEALAVEIASIARMGSASLREAGEALQKNDSIPQSSKVAFLDAVRSRATCIQNDLRYWDLVSIVQAHAHAGVSTDVEIFADLLAGKLSFLSPKHLVDLLSAFETLECRPKELYKAIGNRLIDLVRSSIYADELVALTRVIAIHGMKDAELIAGISQAILFNESLNSQLRILHCCEILGAFAHLSYLDGRLEKMLVEKVQRELQVIPLQELWTSVTGFETLCFSYFPIEDATRNRLKSFILKIESDHFDQVSSPMDFFQFVRLNELVNEHVLLAACKWANNAVYRPATRTESHRRPNIFQVALLADMCRELEVPMEQIEKAVKITVTSKGGTELRVAKRKPLRYRRKRAYLSEPDAYAELRVEPVKGELSQELPRTKKSNEAAFAPLLRGKYDQSLWKSRSGPWFHRK